MAHEQWVVRSTGILGMTVSVHGPFGSFEIPFPPGIISGHGSRGSAERAAIRYAKRWGMKYVAYKT